MMDTLSPWIVIPASVLIVISGLLVLIASIGMVRVSSFLPRTHIQAIIYSTALWALLLASLLLTFNLQDRTFLHEVLIGIFIFITSPVSTILLVRSFVLREERGSTLDESVTVATSRPTVDASEAEDDRTAASDVASIEAELEMEPEQEPETDQDQKNEPDEQTTRRAGPPADLPKA